MKAYLDELKIVVRPYEHVWDFLQGIRADLQRRAPEKGERSKVFTGLAVSWQVELSIGKVRRFPSSIWLHLGVFLTVAFVSRKGYVGDDVVSYRRGSSDQECSRDRRPESSLFERRPSVRPVRFDLFPRWSSLSLLIVQCLFGNHRNRWMAELDHLIRKEKRAVDEWEAGFVSFLILVLAPFFFFPLTDVCTGYHSEDRNMLTEFRSKEKYFKSANFPFFFYLITALSFYMLTDGFAHGSKGTGIR